MRDEFKFKRQSIYDRNYMLQSYSMRLDICMADEICRYLRNQSKEDEVIKSIMSDCFGDKKEMILFCELNQSNDLRLELIYYYITGIGCP